MIPSRYRFKDYDYELVGFVDIHHCCSVL